MTSVQPGSIGDVFGYRFGDQILSINGCPVHDSEDIRRIRYDFKMRMELTPGVGKGTVFLNTVFAIPRYFCGNS